MNAKLGLGCKTTNLSNARSPGWVGWVRRPGAAALAASAVGALSGLEGQALEARDLMAFNVGPVVLKPRFTAVAGYSDNVYYLPADSPLEELGLIESRDDINFVLSPGLTARLGRPEATEWVEFSYRFDQILFLENTDSDSPNHYFTLGAGVAGSRLEYDCNNSFQLLSSILTGYEATVDGVALPSGNVDRNYFNLNHNLAYALTAKSRVRVEGSLGIREYTGSDQQQIRYLDSQDWRVRAGYDYALSQKLRLAGLLHYGQQIQTSNTPNRPDPPQADIFGGSVTATGNLTSKLSGNIRVGYEYRDFEDAESDGYPLVGLGLTQRFTEKTSLSLDYNRGGSVSATTGAGTVTDSVGLAVQQTLGTSRPWFLNAAVRYVHNDYVEQDQTLENFRVTLGAAYQLRKWASVFINYTFELGERTTFDYDVNQVNLGLSLGL